MSLAFPYSLRDQCTEPDSYAQQGRPGGAPGGPARGGGGGGLAPPNSPPLSPLQAASLHKRFHYTTDVALVRGANENEDYSAYRSYYRILVVYTSWYEDTVWRSGGMHRDSV